MTSEQYEKHEDEFLKFDRVQNKTSGRADMHAFNLIDIMDVTKGATVADFQALARAAIAELRAQGVHLRSHISVHWVRVSEVDDRKHAVFCHLFEECA